MPLNLLKINLLYPDLKKVKKGRKERQQRRSLMKMEVVVMSEKHLFLRLL